MKKSQLILRKSLCSLAAIISLVALLSSPVTFKMYETKDYASSLIDTFANQSDGSAMSIAAKAAVEISESYLSLYRLVSRYRQNKRLQSSDLKLPAKNKVQLFMDDLILYLVNSELKVHEGELQQITQIYQLSLWIICVLYLLGVALLLFNRYWSWLPFVLGAASAFGFQVFITHTLTGMVQKEVYSKMLFTYSWGSWAGFLLALALSGYLFYLDVCRYRAKGKANKHKEAKNN